MNPNHTPTAAQFGGVAYARRANELALHVSIGAELHHLRVDRGDFGLSEISRLTLPAPVQYVVPHPTLSLMYVATSNRSISKADDLHTLTTVAVDERTGALRVVGQSTLPSRPIHLTVTPKADSVLVVYNLPAGVSCHAIDVDGVAGSATVQNPPPPLGAYPHQVRVLPSGEAAVVVVRGNHATAQRDEEPGALEFLAWRGGVLAPLGTVAPDGGFRFGPRHLDFHPGGRWAALSLERDNRLQLFAVRTRDFAAAPTFTTSTLQAGAATAGGSPHDQLCGAIHFHPRGDRLYVANRHDPSVYGAAGQPCDRAGNNIAVYAFDATSGHAEAIQHIPTESVHVRTFSFDHGARLLATASILPAMSKQGGPVDRVAARITFFRVADDGRLALARVHDMPNERLSMFWSHLDGSL
jgi:6-phosphogluconolactonase (cycloisomerase 2 family)